MRVFIIKCWAETNGSVQCVSEEMAPDSLLPSSQRGWGGAWKELQAENSGSINFPQVISSTILCRGIFFLQLQKEKNSACHVEYFSKTCHTNLNPMRSIGPAGEAPEPGHTPQRSTSWGGSGVLARARCFLIIL